MKAQTANTVTRTPRRIPVRSQREEGTRIRCRVFRRAERPHFQAPACWRAERELAAVG
jgi:hypothetical protein